MNTSFEQKVGEKLEPLRKRRIVCAFSGGKDSLALLNFLYSCQKSHNFELKACHVNHMFRGHEADADEAFCGKFCAERGIAFVSVRADAGLYARVKKLSFEHAARIVRYRALKSAAQGALILTAHTKSDDIETFFIRLIQGTSVYGLGGINEVRDDICRPMLNVSTDEVNEYLSANGLTPVYDATNSNTAHLRNRVRSEIIPAVCTTEGVTENILSLMEDSARLKADAEEAVSGLIEDTLRGARICGQKFDRLSDTHKEFVLHKMFAGFFRAERRHVRDALHLCTKETSARINMPDGYVFERSFGEISLLPGSVVAGFCRIKKAGDAKLFIPERSCTVEVSGELVNKELTVRTRRAGDRLKSKKLKDIFIDRKTPLFKRDISLVIIDKNSIVWVENITEDDRIVLCL